MVEGQDGCVEGCACVCALGWGGGGGVQGFDQLEQTLAGWW